MVSYDENGMEINDTEPMVNPNPYLGDPEDEQSPVIPSGGGGGDISVYEGQNTVQTFEDGSTLTIGPDGEVVSSTEATDGTTGQAGTEITTRGLTPKTGTTPAPGGTTPTSKETLDKLGSWLKTPAGMAIGATGLAALLQATGSGSSDKTPKGYQGGIPTLQANTTQIPGAIEAAMDRGNYGNVVPQAGQAGQGNRPDFAEMIKRLGIARPTNPETPKSESKSFGDTLEDFGYDGRGLAAVMPQQDYRPGAPDIAPPPPTAKGMEPEETAKYMLMQQSRPQPQAQAQDPSKYHVKGAMGRNYFSPTTFSPVAAAPAAPATGIATVAAPAAKTATVAPAAKTATAAPAVMPTYVDDRHPLNPDSPDGVMYAKGGPTTPRYLQGSTDGMADKLNTSIDGDQPAKLSHGEFVIPADVVSHLGNGNSDAGADVLYKMMDKVRQARTGNPKQGKKINPEKFTPGGIAGYAGGGAVAFVAGGTTGATPSASGAPTNVESSLSSWAGPYVTDMLGKGQALANQPYQAYQGPLTAGSSGLQDQAFAGLGSLQTPAAMGEATKTAGNAATAMGNLSYKPTGIDQFTAGAAQQYMNPYLQASLNPQLEEARRQSQITQMGNAAKATQAGAFGGSRSAIMDTETQRNLGSNLANITGQGYNNAYDKAMAQFNTEQGRQQQAGQFGATYGLNALQGQVGAAATQGSLAGQENQMNLSNIGAQMAGGTTQRGIESEGIAAQQAAYEKERMNPYAQLQFQQSLLQGLPISSSTATTNTSTYQDVMGKINDILGLGKSVSGVVDATTKAPK